MRITTLGFSLAFVLGTAQAQVTITQNEMPHAGDELFRTQAVLNPLLNYGATGPNFTWNFNNLVASGQDSRSYQTVGSTNIIYALVYADIALNGNRANHATEGVDVPFYDILPIENPYTFYFRSASVYRKVGYGAEVAGFPLPITMEQQDVVYQLPLNYGNTSTSNSAYNIAVPTLAYYGYSQQRDNVVDGWGVINTPAGSFNALRVKTTIAGRDTIQVDQVGLGFAIERPLVTEYKWLTPGRRVPILQVNTSTILGVEVITEIWFFDVERTLVVSPPLANNFCPGQQVAVNYTRTGVFNQGGFLVQPNIFRAQLSDATGSFANPVNIGQLTSTASGTINATIPTNTPAGTGYRIRVVATNPGFEGTANSFNITIGTAPQAAVSAAGPVEFCAGGSVVLNATTAPVYTYQWQQGGTNIPGATNPSLQASSSGNYRVLVTTSCGTATSTVVPVVVNALPEHALVPPPVTATCAGIPVVYGSTNISGQTGLNYQWLLDGQAIPGATSNVLSTDVPGSYALQVTNGSTSCNYTTTASTLDVEVVPVPATLANGPTTFCAGASITLEASGSAGATYQWFLDGAPIVGATDADLLVSASGNYTANATSVSGCVSEFSQAIAVTADPVPATPVLSALGPVVFCDGGTVDLVANGDPGVDWQWTVDGNAIPGADSDGLTVNATGTYAAVATNTFGCSTGSATSVTVTVDPVPPVPSALATGPTTVCDGSTVVLEASGADGASYQWIADGVAIAGADEASYVATVSGNYAVTATNSFGCTTTSASSVVVTVDPVPAEPTVEALSVTTFCAGGSVTLVASGDAGVDWQWSRDGVVIAGADADELQVNTTGTYSVVATNSFGCTADGTASIAVLVHPVPPVPTLAVSDPLTFCDGNSVLLTANGAADDTHQWTLDGVVIAGATTNTFEAFGAGNYAAVAISAAGCTSASSANITVNVNPLPATPQISANGPTSFCAGANVGLSATGSPGSAYEWYLNGTAILGAGGAGYTATASGDFTAIAVDANGCASLPSSPITVAVEALPSVPVLTALDATSFCAGSAVVIVATGDDDVLFQWSLNGAAIPGADAAQLVADASGAYSATATSLTGCTSADAVPTLVTVFPLPSDPMLTASGPTTFCAGENVTLLATADAGVQLQWSNNGEDIAGANDPELLVETSGAYAVTATDANGCSSTSGIAMVFSNPVPEALSITAAGTTTLCAGNTVELQAGIAPGITYQWYLDGVAIEGATAQTYAAGEEGDYTVVAISPQSCAAEASASIAVLVNPLPDQPLITLTEPQVLCQGRSTTMVALAAPGVTYQWTFNGEAIPGATASQYTVDTEGLYTVVITDANGCTASAVEGVDVIVNELPDAPVITLDFDVLTASGSGPFQWYLNGTAIAGATGSQITASTNGVYTVSTTNAAGCSATSEPFTVSTVSVRERGAAVFSVYPNPNNGQFSIRLEGTPTGGTFYTIHDATGRLVKQDALVNSITVVELPAAQTGMYFLQVVQGGKTTTQRIVVGR